MSATWTSERILSLAPDPASGKNGRALATPRKWSGLGSSETAVWGLCQGSGSSPYQVRIDLGEPAFKCTCPSRKFPCKHGIGLFLLYAEQPALLPAGAPPGWVTDWLASRGERAQKKVEKAEAAAAKASDPVEQAKRAKEAERRAAKREDLVSAGVEQLDLWLRDLVRSGLSRAQTQPSTFWTGQVGRLVDSKAKGLAGYVDSLTRIVSSGPGWPDRLLRQMARVHLLISGWQKIEFLPPELRFDVRALVMDFQAKETALETPPVPDLWQVLGIQIQDSWDGLGRNQYVWLRGERTGKTALLQSFVPRSNPTARFEHAVPPGFELDAELHFYPSAWPLRAEMGVSRGVRPLAAFSGFPDLDSALDARADALASNPWLERFPMPLEGAIFHRLEDRWRVRDRHGRETDAAISDAAGWQLLAATGGAPGALFGLWQGETFVPVSCMSGGRFAAVR